MNLGSLVTQGFEHYVVYLGDRFIEEVDEVISNDQKLYLKFWKLRRGLCNWRKCRRIQYLQTCSFFLSPILNLITEDLRIWK